MPALSANATREAVELVDVIGRLLDQGDLEAWNIAHADLALTLARVRTDDISIPERVLAFKARTYEHPAVRAYIDHPRPPHPPQ